VSAATRMTTSPCRPSRECGVRCTRDAVINNSRARKEAFITRPPSPEPAPAAAEPSADAAEDGVIVLRSPMKGTFYRAPAPGEPPFCGAGDRVGPDDTVCLVEIMKLFNSIPAGVSGTVEKFFVENAAPVDLNQPIVSIRAD